MKRIKNLDRNGRIIKGEAPARRIIDNVHGTLAWSRVEYRWRFTSSDDPTPQPVEATLYPAQRERHLLDYELIMAPRQTDPDKAQPIGICDLCQGPIAEPYTTKNKPRRYCSRDCRNTGNSRAGADIRSEKNLKRVQAGTWQNPAKLNPPSPEAIGRKARITRQREVAAGTWRNPALTDEARAKLSRPRKHGDNPLLHSAIEKLGQGASVSELTPEEQQAHRTYRAELQAKKDPDEVRRANRERYRRRRDAMSEEEKAVQLEKWRRQNEKRKKKNP